jgi:HEAT repeat protein
MLTGASREAIAEFFESRGHVQHEVDGLAHYSVWQRARAAHVLGDLASKEAVPALVEALGDEERDVRAAAVRSLGQLRDPAAVEPLVRALVHHEVPRAASSQALLAIGPLAADPLRDLARSQECELHATAIELIGLVGDASDGPWLEVRLNDESPAVRANAAGALGRLGDEDAATSLRIALYDATMPVRVAAARALGAIGDTEAREALLERALTGDFDTARAAAKSLARVAPDLAVAAAEEHPDQPHLQEAAGLLALGRA